MPYRIHKITIKQHDITDCEAVCLASVSSHFNLQIPIARIRQYAGTDKKGTNVLGLIEAAEKLGFEAKGVREELDSLFKIPKPAIAHIIVKEQLHHYVVIYEVTKEYIKIMDPGDGEIHKRTPAAFLKKDRGLVKRTHFLKNEIQFSKK